jgi:hypothetical protein
MMTPEKDSRPDFIWIFCGERGDFPSGVFYDLDAAEAWVREHSLTGVLTQYPTNAGVYNWMIERGYFRPKAPHQVAPQFIGRFSSAYLTHYHYAQGERF